MTVTQLSSVLPKDFTVVSVDIGNEGSIFIAGANQLPTLNMMPKSWEARSDAILDCCPSVVYAENVHTMPGQGVVSSGSLMEQKGFLRGACIIAQVRLELISPLEWQECFTMKRTKHFATKTEWKRHLAGIANSLAPESLVNEINYKNADSVLIWIWAAHKEIGQPMKKIASQLTFL